MKKIVIVEDELSLASNIRDLLLTLEYDVVEIFDNSDMVLNFLKEQEVDLILLDIMIEGNLDGIDLAYRIREEFDVAIIFCTAYSDQTFLDRIDSSVHEGYLVKPFNLNSLRASVYMALKTHEENNLKSQHKPTLKIIDKGFLVPVPIEEILFLKADGLYTKVHTDSKTYIMRDILKNLEEKISSTKFVRVHKSFLVNTAKINSFNSKKIIVGEHTIPIRRGFYKELKDILQIS